MPRGRGRERNAIVRRRCEVHNCFIGVDGVSARCQESQIIQQEQDDVNSPNPPDASNDEEMRDVDMVVRRCVTSVVELVETITNSTSNL